MGIRQPEAILKLRNLFSQYSNILDTFGFASGSPLEASDINSTFPWIWSIIFLNSSTFILPIKPFFLSVNVLSVSKQKTHL